MRNEQPKTAASASFSYTQKLSLAAGSLSALYLLPTIAQGAIVHVTTPLSIAQGGVDVEWDVDGAGGNDFVLQYSNFFGFYYLELNSGGGRNGRGFVQQTGDAGDEARNLPLGVSVGPTLAAGYQFGASGVTYRLVTYNGGFSDLLGFSDDVDGHLGFRFETAGNTFFGWATINIDLNNSFTISEWAYNEIPGGSIQVGQTSSPTAVPTPPTHALALLGLGAAGVTAWRRRKTAAQAA